MPCVDCGGACGTALRCHECATARVAAAFPRSTTPLTTEMPAHEHVAGAGFALCRVCGTRMPEVERERLETARRKRDEAIERARGGAPPMWVERGVIAVQTLARKLPELTADDVWPLVQAVDEGRAMGPVMLEAARRNLITNTGRVTPSRRGVNNARPITVWASKVCEV